MRHTLTIKLCTAILISSFLSGCGVLVVGSVVAGASVLADRRAPAVQAIDKGIELEAGNALAKRYGDDAHINITSFNQKVLLTGEVKNADIKSQAGAYVKAMKNARSVFNELAI
jgi:osmotically-inducible protein OsmY